MGKFREYLKEKSFNFRRHAIIYVHDEFESVEDIIKSLNKIGFDAEDATIRTSSSRRVMVYLKDSSIDHKLSKWMKFHKYKKFEISNFEDIMDAIDARDIDPTNAKEMDEIWKSKYFNRSVYQDT
jgi:uncharacterized protein YlbG (UPF0298 family)